MTNKERKLSFEDIEKLCRLLQSSSNWIMNLVEDLGIGTGISEEEANRAKRMVQTLRNTRANLGRLVEHNKGG